MYNDVLIRKADIGDIEDILRLNFDLFKKEKKEYDKSLNFYRNLDFKDYSLTLEMNIKH